MEKSFLKELRELNIERQKEWDPNNKLTLSFRGLEFAGEAGELASKVKKLARKTEFDLIGSNYDLKDIEEEVGDVLITLDLLCEMIGIDIEKVTKEKFNATSTKIGLNTKFTVESDFENKISQLKIKRSKIIPIIGKDKLRNERVIFMNHYDITSFEDVKKGFKHRHNIDIDFCSAVDKSKITIPETYQIQDIDRNKEPFHNNREELYCVIHNENRHYIYAKNGETAVFYLLLNDKFGVVTQESLTNVKYYITNPEIEEYRLINEHSHKFT